MTDEQIADIEKFAKQADTGEVCPSNSDYVDDVYALLAEVRRLRERPCEKCGEGCARRCLSCLADSGIITVKPLGG